mgnify:CR=1 FL=1
MKQLIYGLMLLAILTGCTQRNKSGNDSKELTVTVLPEEYFVKRIAGDAFRINVMVPPGASPATYEPQPSQIASLTKSDLYLAMGYTGFEMAWMEKLKSANPDMTVVNLSEGVDLITEATTHDETDHHHGGIDPHTWLSPTNARIISKNIYTALSIAYPEMEEEMRANLDAFTLELDSLDNYIRTRLADLGSRSFFTFHPSLSYFARDYNLNQYPMELGGKTPSAGHMKALVDRGKEEKIGVIFLQMQFDQKNAEVLAKEIGAEIVQINPLDPDWFNQMVFITDKLKERLQ